MSGAEINDSGNSHAESNDAQSLEGDSAINESENCDENSDEASERQAGAPSPDELVEKRSTDWLVWGGFVVAAVISIVVLAYMTFFLFATRTSIEHALGHEAGYGKSAPDFSSIPAGQSDTASGDAENHVSGQQTDSDSRIPDPGAEKDFKPYSASAFMDKSLSITARIALFKMMLLSCGIITGFGIAYLGFSLFVMGIKDTMSARAVLPLHGQSQTKTGIEFQNLAPGSFLSLLAVILICVCATQVLKLEISPNTIPLPSPDSNSTTPSNATADRQRQTIPGISFAFRSHKEITTQILSDLELAIIGNEFVIDAAWRSKFRSYASIYQTWAFELEEFIPENSAILQEGQALIIRRRANELRETRSAFLEISRSKDVAAISSAITRNFNKSPDADGNYIYSPRTILDDEEQ